MSGKVFGYARVSAHDQKLDRQLDLLEKEYNVPREDIFCDKMSGASLDRPALNELMKVLRPGDTVLIESLSRLSRNTRELLSLLEEWEKQGISLISIKERLDFSSATGKLILTVLAAIASFERDMIRTRVMEGLAAARARGRVGGRKPTDPKKLERALKLYDDKKYSLREIREMTGVSSSVLYRALKKRREESDL